jgi:small conductance mechanosensitive channel
MEVTIIDPLMHIVVRIALALLGVPAAAILTISGTIIVVLAIALRESLTNFAATIIFLLFQPFRKAELIETMGWTGVVQEIQLFNTVLLLGDQRIVSLPNGKIQEGGVMNYTRMGVIRADVAMTVSYGSDLSRVRAVLTDIVAGDPRALTDPPMQIVTQEFGENGVRVEARGGATGRLLERAERLARADQGALRRRRDRLRLAAARRAPDAGCADLHRQRRARAQAQRG